MPPKFRLKDRHRIQKALRRGCVIRSNSLEFFVYARKDVANTQFAFFVPKKYIPKATQRSSIKRKLRALIFPLRYRFASGYDIVILYRSKEVTLSKVVLFQDLNKIFEYTANRSVCEGGLIS